MTNEQGTATAVVLILLAVVSLIGAALLTQSQLDVQLTSSLSSYDQLFGLADGGASIGYEYIRNIGDSGAILSTAPGATPKPWQIFPVAKQITTAPAQQKYVSVRANPPCSAAVNDPNICYTPVPLSPADLSATGLGGYAAMVTAYEPSGTSRIKDCAGWEYPAYVPIDWVADGRGVREHALGGGYSKVETSVMKCTSQGGQ